MFSELLKGSKVLNKDEMKNVTGGETPCPDGQTKYYCTITYEGGGSFSGYVCATSKDNAKKAALKIQDTVDGGVTVVCS